MGSPRWEIRDTNDRKETTSKEIIIFCRYYTVNKRLVYELNPRDEGSALVALAANLPFRCWFRVSLHVQHMKIMIRCK